MLHNTTRKSITLHYPGEEKMENSIVNCHLCRRLYIYIYTLHIVVVVFIAINHHTFIREDKQNKKRLNETRLKVEGNKGE